MTKRELYDALLAAGVKLPEYRRITQQALEEKYAACMAKGQRAQTVQVVNAAQQQAAEPVEEGPQGTPTALFFDHAGWCDALGRSYFMGYYWPQSWAEYEALRPFAKGGAR